MSMTSRLAGNDDDFNKVETGDGLNLPSVGPHNAEIIVARLEDVRDKINLVIEYHTDDGNINQEIPIEGFREFSDGLKKFVKWQLRTVGFDGSISELEHGTGDILGNKVVIEVYNNTYKNKDGVEKTYRKAKSTSLVEKVNSENLIDRLQEEFDAEEVY